MKRPKRKLLAVAPRRTIDDFERPEKFLPIPTAIPLDGSSMIRWLWKDEAWEYGKTYGRGRLLRSILTGEVVGVEITDAHIDKWRSP